MNKRLRSNIVGGITWGLLGIALLARADEPRFEQIFNGRDLSGWRVPEPNPYWTVREGVLVGENDAALKGHVLYTAADFNDFIIELETRWNGEIDSGIMLRKPELQLQFGVSRSLKKDMTCCFYTGGQDKYPEAGRAKGVGGLFRVGEWNKVRLEAKGAKFTVWLNSKRVGEYQNDRYAGSGPVGLQIHPGLPMKVEFRNVKIAKL